MNQNKKGNGWILCSSKSFPGKYYYFNVLNGETAWTLTETEVEKTKKQVQYSTIHSNYPEPLTKPPENAPSNTPTHSQPKTPSTTLPGPKPLVPRFGEAIFPVFLPTKDLPNFVWAPVPIRYINDANTQSFEAQKSNTTLVDLANEKRQSTEDSNQIVVQVHTCNDQFVSKRFVTYSKILKTNETNQTKNVNENPFLSSTPCPSKSYFSFNKNNYQFENDTPNTFQLTENAEYNKNKYLQNPNFIFQSTNNNSEHDEATFFQLSKNEAHTFRDVIKNNGFVTPNKTTHGYEFDTPNQTAHRFDTPKETTPEFDALSFGFHTPNETYNSNTPKKSIICSSDTPKKTSYGFDTLEKAIHGYDTPKKTTFGIDTPNKSISGFDTPKKALFGIDTPITTEIQTKIQEELNNLPEDDLRNILIQRKRKIGNSTNNDENAKKIKTSYNERQATPKKHVTFKLDISDIISSEDFSYNSDEVLETPASPAVESISSLRRLGATDDLWYIVIDLNVLLDHFEYIDAFIKTDPLCRLLVPYSVYKELTTTSIACDSRARVNSARNVLRRLECGDTRYKVQNTVIGSERLKSQKDQIQCCCIELIRNNIHVVLITNNDILYKEAKEKRIHVYKMNQIQNGEPKTPDVTFDIRKIKFQIPNDNCVPNSKEKNVENSENQTVKKDDQNVEQKIDAKYKKSVQNFWRSDNSDSDFSIVSQQIQKLNIFEKPYFENEPKKTPKKAIQKEQTVTSSYLKPITNVVITKKVIQNGSATKESLFGSNFEMSASKMPENQYNDNQYSTLNNLTSNNLDNLKTTSKEEKQPYIFENSASKESEYYINGINRNFIFANPTSSYHNQHSIFKKPASKESENHGNDNQYSTFKNPVSKETENHGNDNQNSIFEIDSNFMPLTTKTVEDYLKKYNIENKMVEDGLKNSADEKICCLRQILEDLADVLKEYSSKLYNSRACVLYNILQKILKMYGKHQLIRDVIEKLEILLYRNDCIDKIRRDLLPIEIMQAIGCGMLLVQLLKELTPSEHLTDIETGLNELVECIENPIYKEFECIETPVVLKGEKNEIYYENRFNFKKDESEIIQYLKKHYPAWADFDETTTSVKQKPEIKIFRTSGKNLNLFKLSRSRIILEKTIKNDESSAKPNPIQPQENDREKTGNIEKDDHTVFYNEEKDKIPNSNDKKPKKSEMNAFLEDFDIENELRSLKNIEKTEPKIIRLFANDKGGEKTNFDSKYTDFDAQNELKGVRNTEKSEPKVIRIISNDKGGDKTNFDSEKTDFDSKMTDFDSKKTDFDLNQTKHENTFQTTETGPKVVRNIAPIPKYEDLFKKSVQNGPLTTKTVQTGLHDSEISLSHTENLTNEDFFLENTKIEKNNEIFKNTSENLSSPVLNNIDFFENSIKCYTISDCTSHDVIDNGIENNLKAAISIFFKEIRTCFQNIHNFIDSSFSKIKNKENTELKSIENKAKKIHGHIVRIIEKLSIYKESKGENMNFSFFHLLNNEENSTDLYIKKCRQLSSLCIEQAKMLEKMVIELCNFNN